MTYNKDFYDKKWTSIIKLLPTGGQYRLDLRQYCYDIIKKEVGKGVKVFDFACGLGIIDIQLEKENYCDVEGCDFSQVAIDYIKGQVSNKTGFKVGTGIPDKKYDCILAIYFLEHIKDPTYWLMTALSKSEKVICAIPRSFNKNGEHVNMQWGSWEEFETLFKSYKWKRIDEYPENLVNGFKHPIILFEKKDGTKRLVKQAKKFDDVVSNVQKTTEDRK